MPADRAGTTTGESRGSKTERSYQLLRARIVDGTYGPGTRLVIDELARNLAISTIPLREAIGRLSAEGYVEMTHNVGARVARFTRTDYVHSMHVLARLEGYATAISAPLLTSDDLSEAHDLNARIAHALDDFDPQSFSALNRDFHFAIYRRCPDAHLRGLLHNEWDRLDLIRRSDYTIRSPRAANSVAEHSEILHLIETDADFDVLEQAAREHKIHTVDAVAPASDDGTGPLTDQEKT